LSRNELVNLVKKRSVGNRQIQVSYVRVVKKFRISKKNKSPKTTCKRDKSQRCDEDSDASSALMDIDHLLDSTPVQHKGTFRKEYERIYRRYGHVDMNCLVCLKRKDIVHSSLIPTSTKIKYLVKDLAMKYRKPSTPTSKTVVYKEMYEVWEKVYTDTSGSFRVKSIKGNYYYSVFVDDKSGHYLTISYARKSEFPLVCLQFVAKIARFPKILVYDSAGEMLDAIMTGNFTSFHFT